MMREGVMNGRYHNKRIKNVDFIYRLWRRTDEVRRIIKQKSSLFTDCLDIGTADGLMLTRLNQIFCFHKAIGIDMSEELLAVNRDKQITLQIGNAEKLDFDDASFDIIIACAVIEHLDSPIKMLSECYRVLRKGGILILTTPNPFHDWIASKVGYLKDAGHTETFTLKRLNLAFKMRGLKVIHSRYFMAFPFFKIPFERQIEYVINLFSIGKIMTNQIIVGRKKR